MNVFGFACCRVLLGMEPPPTRQAMADFTLSIIVLHGAAGVNGSDKACLCLSEAFASAADRIDE